ncbi:hypothetical protein MHBO_002748 [Bonamia ostreae]|uniref:Uncharacterized protein n=1 Tax=Bonamia ostreae TaxID=126728 RepID=A0ABV2ANY9_9EUKA
MAKISKNNLENTVLLVRTALPLKQHFPERVKWFAASICSLKMDLWVIIDDSQFESSTEKAKKALGDGIRNVRCATVNKNDFFRIYKKQNFGCCPDNPLYCYHAEAVNVWYSKYVESSEHFKQKYRYFWFWEDDLAFSGDVSKFFEFYADSEADLIAINYETCDVINFLSNLDFRGKI